MPLRTVPSATILLTAAVVAVATTRPALAEPKVIAIVASDGYSDLRKQLAWFGGQVGNPAIVLIAESMLAGATGGRGLAGLDVKRPFGVVITADGEAIAGSGFLPVTDTDKLLDSLQGTIGPATKDGDDRTIGPPGVGGVRISTKDGWARLVPEASPAGAAGAAVDPADTILPLSEEFTLAVKFFPSRMPKALLEQLAERLEAAADNAAARGQPIDTKALVGGLESLEQTESLVAGLKLDETKNRVLLELQSVAEPGSDAARAVADLGGAPLTVPLPRSEERPMARGFVAQRVPEAAADQVVGWIDASEAGDSDDPLTKALLGSFRAIAKAAVASGRLDGSMSLANTAAAGEKPALEFTGGMHVKESAAVEKALEQLLGPDANLPPIVNTKLNAGTVAGATLHTVEVDLSASEASATLGDSLEATIAVAPESVHLLVGGDAKGRLATMLGQPAPTAQATRPIGAVQVSVDQWLSLAAASAKASGQPQAEQLAAAADAAGSADSAIVQVQVRPIERGVAWQMAVDSGVLKAAVTAIGGAGAGLPIGGGALGGLAP